MSGGGGGKRAQGKRVVVVATVGMEGGGGGGAGEEGAFWLDGGVGNFEMIPAFWEISGGVGMRDLWGRGR